MNLTTEQEAIIHHPLGHHARVLAVAGSGKTTTMVYRIKYLVEELQQDPARIRVVMFNRLAREQFEQKLAEEILDIRKRPKVLTFHALALSLRKEAEKSGLMPQYKDLWTGDREELALVCMHQAIDSLMREQQLMSEIDSKVALDTIGLWKASLIPPERAGHHTDPDLPLVYRRFEELREQARALTFDDFVPKAMELLESNIRFCQRFTNRLDHLIVDEYQDINYGQQQLIRLLAGSQADVMVVGDDDQTIYEWRAARPHYILRGFKQDFANKPVDDYTLSHSFRFGPLIAQTAYNTIIFNQERERKPLVAHEAEKVTGITVFRDESEQASSIAVAMAEEIETLVRKQQVSPKNIIVLGRTFVQLEGLQATCIERRIPFRVLGQGPFFERDENRTLIDYFRLALAWRKPATALKPWRAATVSDGAEEASAQERGVEHYRRIQSKGLYTEAVRTVLAVANTPSRQLARKDLQKAVEQNSRRGTTLGDAIEYLLDSHESPWPEDRRENLQELVDFLHRIAECCATEQNWKAGDALDWMVEKLDYTQHFNDYYGEGSASQNRIDSVERFIRFARRTGKSILDFVEYLSHLDSTLGHPTDEIITMTTVHRTKGLEYDYVFLPYCVDGYTPVHIVDDIGIYDKEDIVPDFPPSPPLESERRLFYVAITRAKKHLYIGTISPPQSGQQLQSTIPLPSRFLEEMRLPPTEALIDGLQQLISTEVAEKLIAAVQEWSGYVTITRYVLERYLAEQSPSKDLRIQLLRILEGISEKPFQYRYGYPELGEMVKSRTASRSSEIPAWVDPWA